MQFYRQLTLNKPTPPQIKDQEEVLRSYWITTLGMTGPGVGKHTYDNSLQTMSG